MSGFQLHDDFAATSIPLGDLDLCHVRLQSDQRWPWLILIPRRDNISEIDHLDPGDQMRLMAEQVRAMEAVRSMGEALLRPVTKLNVAALGNVTPQLHVHVIGRRVGDAAWPRPVWGVGTAEPYSDPAQTIALASARAAMGL